MRLLLVGDNLQECFGLKANLEREFFAVDFLPEKEKALRLSHAIVFDLIIINDQLPGVGVRESCEEIRKRVVATPILIMSEQCTPELTVSLLGAGADDCMGKPYSFKELVARISALLRRPRQMLSEDLRVGDLSLNLAKHSVSSKGKAISLTRKEFMLLEYLMRNCGTVLSRGQILEHVWDINADPFTNTIESHILSLRKKIDHSGITGKLIHTISGRGYKLDLPY